MATNFDITPNDEVEKFEVEFGEVQRVSENDFNKLINRPSYDGQIMNGDTNIPEVPTAVSQLSNDAGYQTAEDVASALEDKQDKLTAGDNITISEDNTISATDTTYTAGNGLNLSGENEFSIDQTVVATQQNLSTEVTNRENADIALQGQIDAISASSDVVDIVGTYAELQAYDTSKLKDNDIVKVLQDSTQNNATTYYRWSTHTETFTLIGSEGPYYTKSAADAQFVPQTRTVNNKALSSNITLDASDVNAVGTNDIVQTTGTNTAKVMSQKATTDNLNSKVNTSDVEDHLANTTNPLQNKVLYGLFNEMPSDYFSGGETVTSSGSEVTLNGTIEAKLNDLELKGDTVQQTYTGKNLLAIQDGTYDSGNGVTAIVENGVITISGTNTGSSTIINFNLLQSVNLPAGTYTLAKNVISSVDEPSRYPYIEVRQSNATIVGTDYDNITKTVTLAEQKTIDAIRLYFGNKNGTSVFEPQLEVGSTATAFEPYVGGTASPNPDYPQAVNVVTGSQAIAITGKNICDESDLTYIYSSNPTRITLSSLSNGIKCTVSEGAEVSPIVLFKSIDLTNHRGSTVRFRANFTGDDIRIGRMDASGSSRTGTVTTSTSGNEISFVVPNDLGSSPYLFYGFKCKSSSTQLENDYTDLILTIDNTTTPFQPYQSQSYTVNLGSVELCKIGDYQDYIYKSGDDWYVHKEIDKYTFDGTENWITEPYGTNSWRIGGLFPNLEFDAEKIICLFDISKGVPFNGRRSGDATQTCVCYLNTTGTLIIRNTTITTQAQMQSASTGKNFYYWQTPTDTQITDASLIAQLDALYNATSYEDQTNFKVTATSPNPPAILGVSAYKKSLEGTLGAIANLQNYVDKNLGNIETALNVINNGAGV